jgi:DUF1680 family protein
VEIVPGRWAKVDADWSGDDLVTLRFPLRLRLAPIHPAYPWRTALMAGPVMLASYPLRPLCEPILLTKAPRD